MNQTLAYIKGEINSNKVIKGGFNTPLTSINRPSRQKYQPHKTCQNRWTQHIYKAFHPKATEYTFFSNTHGSFSRIGHVLGLKSTPNKCKSIETISSVFPYHNGINQKLIIIKNWKIDQYMEIM